MKFNRLSLLAALVLAPCMALGQQQLPTVTVLGQADYTGIWRPDHDTNIQLERDMRKKMKEARGPKPRPPAFPSEGADQQSAGGGHRPGPSSGRPGGPPPDGGPAEPSLPGSIRPEMDFAAPLQNDLQIVSTGAELLIGRSDTPLARLGFGRGATELADGHSRAFVAWEDKRLVVEINTDDGIRMTHTYSLESQGERMRVRTSVTGRTVGIPGGMEMEHLYVRQP